MQGHARRGCCRHRHRAAASSLLRCLQQSIDQAVAHMALQVSNQQLAGRGAAPICHVQIRPHSDEAVQQPAQGGAVAGADAAQLISQTLLMGCQVAQRQQEGDSPGAVPCIGVSAGCQQQLCRLLLSRRGVLPRQPQGGCGGRSMQRGAPLAVQRLRRRGSVPSM